jgi:uncharacterized membrane protein
MVLDDEVMAVLTAVVMIASIIGIAMMLPRNPEPFLAIGLLNERGKIGDYPRLLVTGEPIRLQVFLENHMGKASMLKVEAKLGSRGRIPTNKTPLDAKPFLERIVILNHGQNATIPVEFSVKSEGVNLALVFELWMYDTSRGTWVYTGRWCHLYVNVTRGGP